MSDDAGCLMSDDAVEAKRLRRRLERRWKRDHQKSDRFAYRLACCHANKLINCSHHDYFRNQIGNAADCKDIWRATKHLLHSDRSSLVKTVVENVKLCTTFSNFLWTKFLNLKLLFLVG